MADPFLIKKDGKHYCFVEEYDYKTKLGHISVYEIIKDSCKALGIALKEDFHISYPFLLEYENEIYMCPETTAAKEIRLYNCIDFPLKWEASKVLMSDVSAADTNIFYKDKKWWMLTNLCTASVGDHGSEMHVFSSDKLMSDNWKAHPKNPVIFDPLNGRNGGLIVQGDDVYRVFQTQGFDLYGAGSGVTKITTLNQTEYVEELQFEVTPNFFPNLKGTHSFNFSEGLVTLDFAEIANHKRGN